MRSRSRSSASPPPPPADPLEADFGPEPEQEPEGGASARPAGARKPYFTGPMPPVPCGGEGCLLRPIVGLVERFTVQLAARGHAESLSHAAVSGLELLKALRDFLDEEIALAERAAESRRQGPRYSKIPVD